MKKLLVLSGKGGTGKTTLSSAFIHFSKAKYYADCDIDAPNLHLVMGQQNPAEKKDFIGSKKAWIDETLCKNCAVCLEVCRFHAIVQRESACQVNEYSCEGCGVCTYLCPQGAIQMQEDIAGELSLYKGERVFSTAKLKMGRGNSGKLVSEVKKALWDYDGEDELTILDGSPGTGCPVIASIAGVDLVLVVTEPSLSGLNDLKRILKTIQMSYVKAVVCINKYDVNLEQARLIEAYCSEQNIPIVGRVPYDREVLKFVNQGSSIVESENKLKDILYEVYLETIKYL